MTRRGEKEREGGLKCESLPKLTGKEKKKNLVELEKNALQL